MSVFAVALVEADTQSVAMLLSATFQDTGVEIILKRENTVLLFDPTKKRSIYSALGNNSSIFCCHSTECKGPACSCLSAVNVMANMVAHSRHDYNDVTVGIKGSFCIIAAIANEIVQISSDTAATKWSPGKHFFYIR